jgi:two-component system LytT family response regulator
MDYRMNIRAIIIEDEQHNRENLLQMITAHCPEVDIVAVCSSAGEGRESLLSLHPDLIFLDIEMPGESGFSLLENLPRIEFEVIFVTAYDYYGIKAIKFSALDYLLKPVDTNDLVTALGKAKEKILQKQENLRLRNMLENARRSNTDKILALSMSDKVEFIEVASIIRCESDGNYTTFYLKNGEKLLISKTLKEYDELLTPYGFLRVHQSHLINLKEIKSFIKTDGGYIKMKDGSSVSISRQRREIVLKALL